MTGAAIATIRYSSVVTNIVTKTLTVILCLVATLTVTALLVTTIIHAFILRDLFPNDIAIAIVGVTGNLKRHDDGIIGDRAARKATWNTTSSIRIQMAKTSRLLFVLRVAITKSSLLLVQNS
ncbi:UNVERIFIED_CONTAM: S-type anion channel SLAH3 [Sesamum calycinum]|uniref:S-type anion channel SLAH3 n=1 Tax=Sesamum calycinum TaxID=2727403 RepID=A0AAW2RQZ9_9LAMI